MSMLLSRPSVPHVNYIIVFAIIVILCFIGYRVYKTIHSRREKEKPKRINEKPVQVCERDITCIMNISEAFQHEYTGYLLSIKLPIANIPDHDKQNLTFEYPSNGLMPKFDWELLSNVKDIRKVIKESSIREGFAVELSNAYSMMVAYEACIKNRAESVAEAVIAKFKLT